MAVMELPTISVANHEVPFRDAGSGNAILFLHGYDGPPSDPSALDTLAEAYRVVAPTHPGFADSTANRELQDVHNAALLYVELLDRLGIDEVNLVGHSLGGMLAAEVAALAPDRVRKLVLVAPFGLWFDEHPVPDIISAGGSFLAKMLWADPERDADHQQATAPIQRSVNLAMASNYLWPLPDRGLRNRLYRLRMPILLMRGDADKAVTAGYLDEWHELLPESQVQTIQGAGHFPMIEQPDAFVSAVRDFLA